MPTGMDPGPPLISPGAPLISPEDIIGSGEAVGSDDIIGSPAAISPGPGCIIGSDVGPELAAGAGSDEPPQPDIANPQTAKIKQPS